MRRVMINLGLLIFTGTWVLAWMSRFTEWTPFLITLLGFGGLFTWTALVGKSLPESVVKGFRLLFLRYLRRPASTRPLLLALIVSVIIPCFFGAILIRSTVPGFDSALKIYGEGGIPGEAERFPAEGELRAPEVTFPWGRRMRVKAEGYPDVRVPVFPFVVSPLVVPNWLRKRSVILLLPRGDFLADALIGGIVDFHIDRLESTTEGTKEQVLNGNVPDYGGEPLWIGCDRDVRLPPWASALIADYKKEWESHSPFQMEESKRLKMNSPRCPDYGDHRNCEFDLKLGLDRGKVKYTLVVSYKQGDQAKTQPIDLVRLNEPENYSIAICH